MFLSYTLFTEVCNKDRTTNLQGIPHVGKHWSILPVHHYNSWKFFFRSEIPLLLVSGIHVGHLLQFELCEARSPHAAEAGVQFLVTFLSQLPSCCDYRHAPACLACFLLLERESGGKVASRALGQTGMECWPSHLHAILTWTNCFVSPRFSFLIGNTGSIMIAL